MTRGYVVEYLLNATCESMVILGLQKFSVILLAPAPLHFLLLALPLPQRSCCVIGTAYCEVPERSGTRKISSGRLFHSQQYSLRDQI